MNKHEEARKILNQFRNAHYNDIGCEEEKVVAQALNVVLPYLVATEKELEELKKELENTQTNYRIAFNSAVVEKEKYEELKDDIGVLLRVLDAPSDDPEAKYILDQILIKLSKVGEK